VRSWSERRKALAFAAVLAVAVTLLFLTASALNRLDVSGISVARDVSLRIEGGNSVVWYNVTETRNLTVFTFLLEASAAKGFAVTWFSYGPPLEGVLVTTIGGDANGAGNPQRFWQFWIDGRYGTAGADRVPLHDGASVEWRFVPSQEG